MCGQMFKFLERAIYSIALESEGYLSACSSIPVRIFQLANLLGSRAAQASGLRGDELALLPGLWSAPGGYHQYAK